VNAFWSSDGTDRFWKYAAVVPPPPFSRSALSSAYSCEPLYPSPPKKAYSFVVRNTPPALTEKCGKSAKQNPVSQWWLGVPFWPSFCVQIRYRYQRPSGSDVWLTARSSHPFPVSAPVTGRCPRVSARWNQRPLEASHAQLGSKSEGPKGP